jgi:hypothetical protein
MRFKRVDVVKARLVSRREDEDRLGDADRVCRLSDYVGIVLAF